MARTGGGVWDPGSHRQTPACLHEWGPRRLSACLANRAKGAHTENGDGKREREGERGHPAGGCPSPRVGPAGRSRAVAGSWQGHSLAWCGIICDLFFNFLRAR